MSDSKILMLPEYGYGNNANNLGLGGWGGGILGFILGILLGNNGIGGFGGFGGGYGVANILCRTPYSRLVRKTEWASCR